MLIFGHPWLDSPRFVKVFSIAEIEKTRPEEILLLEPLNVSIELAKHCQRNGLRYAVTISDIREGIFANALGAAYVVSEHEQAITLQKIAEDYLFDAKILVLIEDERRIETMVRFGIDGVIFPAAIAQL
jgi:hypothetical protein